MKRKSQATRLLELLSDGKRHRTDEVQHSVYGALHLGTARIASRVNDLRKKGYIIPEAERDPNTPTLYWYQLSYPPKPKPRMEVRFEMRDGVETAVVVPSRT